MNKLPDQRIYYAQNREDIILESFFGDMKKGFYVDVGACHPDDASVTKRFYLKGWHGINIEPQTNLHELFVRDRERDINLNIGVGDKKGSLTLRSYIYNQGLSSVVAAVMNEHESFASKSERFEDVEIEIKTLEDIFKANRVKSIQFLKIDVEGYEYEVLAGNNWSKFRPEVLCIEANHIVKDWRPILAKNSYDHVFFDGLNEYYVDSNTDRAEKFHFVDHLLLKLRGGIAAEDYDKIVELKLEVEELNSSLKSKSVELESVKQLTKKLIQTARLRIKNKIINKNYKHKR